MFRGNIGFTPRWMAMTPKEYTQCTTPHNGVMAANRCGRDDLIGVQKKEQGTCIKTQQPQLQSHPQLQPQDTQQAQQAQQSQQSQQSTKGMTNEQKRMKRKRDLLLTHMSDLDTEEDKNKRRKKETQALEKRCVPMSHLFKQQQQN